MAARNEQTAGGAPRPATAPITLEVDRWDESRAVHVPRPGPPERANASADQPAEISADHPSRAWVRSSRWIR